MGKRVKPLCHSFSFNFDGITCSWKSWIHSKSYMQRQKTLYQFITHAEKAQLHSWFLWFMDESLRGSLKGDLLHRQPQLIYSIAKIAISFFHSTTCADKIYSNCDPEWKKDLVPVSITQTWMLKGVQGEKLWGITYWGKVKCPPVDGIWNSTVFRLIWKQCITGQGQIALWSLRMTPQWRWLISGGDEST